MKFTPRKTALFLGRSGLYVGCGIISLYILASGYESVYNRALPFVHALKAVDISPLGRSYNIVAAYHEKPSYYGQFGKPSIINISSTASTKRLSIVSPIMQDETWLARSASMHLLIPNKPVSGNISTAILYCRASFRTIAAGRLPAVGSNIFVDTDQQWRYVYKVSLAKTYATSYPYKPTEITDTQNSKGRMIIFCNDEAHSANDVIEADLISVQGLTQ